MASLANNFQSLLARFYKHWFILMSSLSKSSRSMKISGEQLYHMVANPQEFNMLPHIGREEIKSWWKSFFNSSEEIEQRSEFKRSENAVYSMSEQRPAGRPPNWHALRAQQQLGRPEQSTNYHAPTFCWRPSTDRSIKGRGRSTDSQICLSYQKSNTVSDPESNPIVIS